MADPTQDLGAPFGNRLSSSTEPPSSGSFGPPGFDPARGDDHDPYWDYDDSECGNCGGEGFTYGCSWDWQCDTYDEGEGTCLCTRPCDWCQPRPRNAELAAVLAEGIAPTSGEPK